MSEPREDNITSSNVFIPYEIQNMTNIYDIFDDQISFELDDVRIGFISNNVYICFPKIDYDIYYYTFEKSEISNLNHKNIIYNALKSIDVKKIVEIKVIDFELKLNIPLIGYISNRKLTKMVYDKYQLVKAHLKQVQYLYNKSISKKIKKNNNDQLRDFLDQDFSDIN